MSKKNNITCFNTIDTEEKAYWLGFLYADGYVSKTENKIELTLAEKDFDHLVKFKNFLNIPNRICYRSVTKSYRISFRSSVCRESLINHGCIPTKSLVLKFPNFNVFSNIGLIRHFIRGYFDGDGWFTNTLKSFQVGLIGTEHFLKGVIANSPLKTTTNKIFSVHRDNGAKRYVCSSYKNVRDFLNFLYQDSSIYLERKYQKYLLFMNN